MPVLGWTESLPSATSLVGHAPAYLRSVWTTLTTGLATDLLWDGIGGASAASRGDLRPGAARTFVAPASASSNANTAKLRGRLFWASDTSRLFVYDSAGTFLAGTPFLSEYGSAASIGGIFQQPFRELSGATSVSDVTTGASRTVDIGGAYTTKLFQPLTALVTSSAQSVCARIVRTGGGLSINYRGTTNAGSSTTLSWTIVARSLETL